ncbi:hypothetical protein TNCV_1841631 [Trichonephila clavipes]|nr:hypothetical protein TNCV_1841631 [Trichonephila clavipes]
MDLRAVISFSLDILKEFLQMYRRESPSRSIEYNFSFVEYTPEKQRFIHEKIEFAYNRSLSSDNLRFTFDDSPNWLEMLTAVPQGLRSSPGEDMDICKCIVPLRHGGSLNSRRAASPLVWLVEGEEM